MRTAACSGAAKTGGAGYGAMMTATARISAAASARMAIAPIHRKLFIPSKVTFLPWGIN
jgi:hypothetical protein